MVDNQSLGIITNFGAGIGVFIAVLLLYDLLRYFFPGFFFYREQAARDPANARYDNTPFVALPRPSSYPLSWIPSTITYPETKLINTHGLDVALYVRFLSTQVKVFSVLTVFTAIVLYPTYITAENRNLLVGNPRRPIGIEVASLSNVADQSNRLWVTLCSEIFIVATILFFLYRDIVAYTKYRRQYRSDPYNPSNYAIIILDIPEEHRTHQQVFQAFEKLFPGEVRDVHIVRDAKNLLKFKEKYVNAVSKRERAEWDTVMDAATTEALATRGSFSEPQQHDIPDHDDIAICQKRQDDLHNQLVEQEAVLDDIAPVTNAAIVVFKSKRTATFAATAPVWTSTQSWAISRAAEPRGINWNRLDISGYTMRMRQYISFAALTAFAILWTFPAGFIQALSSFDEFSKQFPNSFLSTFKDNNPDFTKFLEGVLPPLLLFLALLLVPVIVRFIVSFERIHSRVMVEAKIRNYLYFFYFMSNFVYVVIIGSVFSKFKAVIDNPATLVSLLSTSVPAQATFLMKYLLINAFLGSTLGMLNIGRLLVRPFLMARAKTPREKRKADRIFAHYPFSKTYAICAMVALIAYVYCTIAPVICAVALIYFSIAYLCTKQLLMYSHRGFFEGGGFLFRDAWTALLVGLYTHQLAMIGIFSLKLATAQAILAVLSFIFSVWFTLYCRKTFLVRAKHGSLMDQQTADDEASLKDEIPEGFSDLYLHPGLNPVEEIALFEEKEVTRDKKLESLAP